MIDSADKIFDTVNSRCGLSITDAERETMRNKMKDPSYRQKYYNQLGKFAYDTYDAFEQAYTGKKNSTDAVANVQEQTKQPTDNTMQTPVEQTPMTEQEKIQMGLEMGNMAYQAGNSLKRMDKTYDAVNPTREQVNDTFKRNMATKTNDEFGRPIHKGLLGEQYTDAVVTNQNQESQYLGEQYSADIERELKHISYDSIGRAYLPNASQEENEAFNNSLQQLATERRRKGIYGRPEDYIDGTNITKNDVRQVLAQQLMAKNFTRELTNKLAEEDKDRTFWDTIKDNLSVGIRGNLAFRPLTFIAEQINNLAGNRDYESAARSNYLKAIQEMNKPVEGAKDEEDNSLLGKTLKAYGNLMLGIFTPGVWMGKKGESWDMSDFKNFFKGAKDVAVDPDTWAMGFLGLSNSLQDMTIINKLKKEEDLNDKESKYLESLITLATAKALRANNTSWAYESGAMAAESLPFMLEFLMTAGVADAVNATGKGLTKGLMKWLAEKTGAKAGARMNKVTGQLLRSADYTKFGLQNRGAIRAADAAWETLATPAARMWAMPTTYSGATDQMLDKINAEGKVERGLAQNWYGIFQAIGSQYLETASESMGWIFGKALKTAGKPFNAIWDATKRVAPSLEKISSKYANSTIKKIVDASQYNLEKAGFHGIPEEMFEEIPNTIGNYLLGVQSEDELRDFFTVRNFKTMAVSFGSTAFLGMAHGGLRASALAYKMRGVEEKLREQLRQAGKTDEEITTWLRNLDNVDATTQEQMFQEAFTNVSSFEKQKELAKNLSDYVMYSTARDMIFATSKGQEKIASERQGSLYDQINSAAERESAWSRLTGNDPRIRKQVEEYLRGAGLEDVPEFADAIFRSDPSRSYEREVEKWKAIADMRQAIEENSLDGHLYTTRYDGTSWFVRGNENGRATLYNPQTGETKNVNANDLSIIDHGEVDAITEQNAIDIATEMEVYDNTPEGSYVTMVNSAGDAMDEVYKVVGFDKENKLVYLEGVDRALTLNEFNENFKKTFQLQDVMYNDGIERWTISHINDDGTFDATVTTADDNNTYIRTEKAITQQKAAEMRQQSTGEVGRLGSETATDNAERNAEDMSAESNANSPLQNGTKVFYNGVEYEVSGVVNGYALLHSEQVEDKNRRDIRLDADVVRELIEEQSQQMQEEQMPAQQPLSAPTEKPQVVAEKPQSVNMDEMDAEDIIEHIDKKSGNNNDRGHLFAKNRLATAKKAYDKIKDKHSTSDDFDTMNAEEEEYEAQRKKAKVDVDKWQSIVNHYDPEVQAKESARYDRLSAIDKAKEDIKRLQKLAERKGYSDVLDILADTEPQTLEEVVAWMFMKPGFKINQESLLREVFKSRKDIPGGLKFMVTKEGGKTIAQLGEDAVYYATEEHNVNIDKDDANIGRNAVIEALFRMDNLADFRATILNNRIATAQSLIDAREDMNQMYEAEMQQEAQNDAEHTAYNVETNAVPADANAEMEQREQEQRRADVARQRQENKAQTDKKVADLGKASEKTSLLASATKNIASDRKKKRDAELKDFAKFVTDSFGAEVEFDDNLSDNENGYYDEKTNKIFFSTKTRMPLTWILGHELNHRLQDLGKRIGTKEAQDAYKKFQEAIFAETPNYEELAKKRFDMQNAMHDAGQDVPSITMEEALEEVAADRAGDLMLSNDFWKKVEEKEPSLWQSLKQVWEDIIDAIAGVDSHKDAPRTNASYELEKLMKAVEVGSQYNDVQIRHERPEFIDVEAPLTEEQEQNAENVLDVVNEENESTGRQRHSLSTWENGGRDKFAKYLQSRTEAKDNKLSKEVADTMLAEVDKLYKTAKELYDTGEYKSFNEWSIAPVKITKDGHAIYSVIKKNSEYDKNIDFSLVCKKRRTLDAVFNRMIERDLMDIVNNDQMTTAIINDIIEKHGLEIACSLCFVDARRYRQMMTADTFTTLWNGIVATALGKEKTSYFNFANQGKDVNVPTAKLTPSGIKRLNEFIKQQAELCKKNGKKSNVEMKVAQYLLAHPEDLQLTQRSDFMSTSGFDGVNTKAKKLLGLYNSKKGTGGPKSSENDMQYQGEISDKNWAVAPTYEVGGVRIQSFSDFMPFLTFDYMQMVADLAAGKLPAHSYTKEYDYVMLFGKTGIKINMSLVPDYVEDGVAAGLDKYGNYIWKKNQTFDYEKAMEIQNTPGYRENCGTIAVGVSDEHIRKMLADPNIRMVIPYHASGINAIVAIHNNIDKFTDYTDEQNTKSNIRGADGKMKALTKAQKKQLDFNILLRKLGNPELAAQAYLDICSEKGYTPKFSRFLTKDKNGNWQACEGYYKMLEDFTTYIPSMDGKSMEYHPQGAVTNTYPDNLKEVMATALKNDNDLAEKRAKEVDPIVDEIEARYNEGKLSGRYSINPFVAERKAKTVANMFKTWAMSEVDTDVADYVENNTSLYSELGDQSVETIQSYLQSLDDSEFRKMIGGRFYLNPSRSEINDAEYVEENLDDIVDWLKSRLADKKLTDTKWLKDNAQELVDAVEYDESFDGMTEAEVRKALDLGEEAGISDESATINTEKLKKRRFSISPTDSQGRKLTDAQREYFADSKVVDEQGNLLEVYHGSPIENITTFDRSRAGQNSNVYNDSAIWFSDVDGEATNFAYKKQNGSLSTTEKRGEKGEVYSAYLNMTNPFDFNKLADDSQMMDDLYESLNDDGMFDSKSAFVKRVKSDLDAGNHQSIKTLIDFDSLESKGYDGVVARMYSNKNNNDALEYGVFNANQIKSVDNQSPTEDADIRFSISQQEVSDKQYEKAKAIVDELNSLGETGFEIARSQTHFGTSTYITGHGLKFRISDHGLGVYRSMNEIPFDYNTTIDRFVKEIEVEKKAQSQRQEKWAQERQHTEELYAKWNRIKDDFKDVVFKSNLSCRQDYETFSNAGSFPRTNVVQIVYKPGSYEYYWTEPAKGQTTGSKEPNLKWLEHYDEGAKDVTTTRFSISPDFTNEQPTISEVLRQSVAEYMRQAGHQAVADKKTDLTDLGVDEYVKQLVNESEQTSDAALEARQVLRDCLLRTKDTPEKNIELLTTVAKEMLNSRLNTKTDLVLINGVLATINSNKDKSKINIVRAMERLFDIIAPRQLHTASKAYDKLMKMRMVDAEGGSHSVAKNVDDATREAMRIYRITLQGDSTHDVMSAEKIDARLDEIETILNNPYDSDGKEVTLTDEQRYRLENEAMGLQMARMYYDTIGQAREDYNRINDEISALANNEQISRNIRLELTSALHDEKRIAYDELIGAYDTMTKNLANLIEGGKSTLLEQIKANREHKKEILHYAFSDLAGVKPMNDADRAERSKAFAKMMESEIFNPTRTMLTEMKKWARTAAEGKGYIYDHFARGWVDARQKELNGLTTFKTALDEKIQELFGKKKHFDDVLVAQRQTLIKDFNYNIKLDPDGAIIDNGEKIDLNVGQAMLIYMWNKEKDGEVKLRAMGIGEETCADIESKLNEINPAFTKLCDWMQHEFLPTARGKYNMAHLKMFGTQMAQIENYFPLAISKSRTKAGAEGEDSLLTGGDFSSMMSTTVGAIKNRTFNTLPLDIANNDALSLMVKHVTDMEWFSAYGPLATDMNTLLSNTTFVNKIERLSPGGARRVKDELAKIMFGRYSDKASGNAFMTDFVKLAAKSKINFRLWTAFKQFASYPAFFADRDISAWKVQGHVMNPVWAYQDRAWCLENLPMFRQRIDSKVAGNEQLDTSELNRYRLGQAYNKLSEYGMKANGFVDGLTCAIGAKLKYDGAKKRYLDYGYSEADAERMAIEDAEIVYNETQQSSEGMFMSQLQKSKEVFKIALTAFQNSQMGYTRKFIEGLREIGKHYQHRNDSEMEEYAKKKHMRAGLTEEQAEIAAKKDVKASLRQAFGNVTMFGWGIGFAWKLVSKFPELLACLGGDGDDDNEKALDIVLDAAVCGSSSSLQGYGHGAIVDEVVTGVNNWLRHDEKFKFNEGSGQNLLVSDLFNASTEIIKGLSVGDGLRVANITTGLATEFGLGIDINTISNAAMGFYDMKNLVPEFTWKEMYIDLAQIANIPSSQLKSIRLDPRQYKTADEFINAYFDFKKRGKYGLYYWAADDAKTQLDNHKKEYQSLPYGEEQKETKEEYKKEKASYKRERSKAKDEWKEANKRK